MHTRILPPLPTPAHPPRPQVCAELMLLKPAVVRGNASEILALAGAAGAAVKGVDSTAAAAGECERARGRCRCCCGGGGGGVVVVVRVAVAVSWRWWRVLLCFWSDDGDGMLATHRQLSTPADALGAAKQLAARHGCVVAVSGAEDLVTDGSRVVRVANGVPLLQQVTATGCSGEPAACRLLLAAACCLPGAAAAVAAAARNQVLRVLQPHQPLFHTRTHLCRPPPCSHGAGGGLRVPVPAAAAGGHGGCAGVFWVCACLRLASWCTACHGMSWCPAPQPRASLQTVPLPLPLPPLLLLLLPYLATAPSRPAASRRQVPLRCPGC